jgi:hypothetical protein
MPRFISIILLQGTSIQVQTISFEMNLLEDDDIISLIV